MTRPLVSAIMWAVIALVALALSLFLGGSKEVSDPRTSDAFCLTLLAKPNHKEALSWLEESPGKHTLGELQTSAESIALVQEVYRVGAVAVTAVEIDVYPSMENRQNTGKLVVTLPDEPSARRLVLEWAGGIAESMGFDAEPDMGQKYVFVALD